MADIDTLLAAYDDQMCSTETTDLPQGVRAERDGPIVRIVGQHRGFISSPSDLGIGGAELDALIARRLDFFAARGEAVEWKTRGYDRLADIVERLSAAGFAAEEQESVVIGLAVETAHHDAPVPEGIVVRQTSAERDMYRIATMESEVWGSDMGWMADDLIGRVRKRICRAVGWLDVGQLAPSGDLPGTRRSTRPAGLRAWVRYLQVDA